VDLANSFVTVLPELLAFLRQVVDAKETTAARDSHRPDHPIANVELFTGHLEQFALDFIDNADRFVAEHAGRWTRSATGKSMEIAAANGAKRNANESLPCSQFRRRTAREPERTAGTIEYR
jgi:hypothetical protein